MQNNVYIVGVGMTALGKFVDKSVKDFSKIAVNRALKDAQANVDDIQAVWFSNSRQGLLEGQNGIRGQCALRPLGFNSIPITNIENACCSGSSAVLQAFAHIKAGLCDVAIAVGAEKMFFPQQRDAMLRAFLGGTDIYRLEEFQEIINNTAVHLIPDSEKNAVQAQHSFFMDSYAAQARLHMSTFGTTQRQFAAAAAKNHWHSTMNPLAQYQHNMSIDEVLNARSISWPFTLPMCAPISDGGAAIILCSQSALSRFNHHRAVKVRGISLAGGSGREAGDFTHHIGAITAAKAYEMAAIEPSDIDVVEVHDACAYAEIQQIENLGLCAVGEGGSFTASGHTKLGGKVPVNTSGGLVSKGHPVGATGIIQLHELVSQLRGEANKRQVQNARIAVAENGGGYYEGEEAATVVTVLESLSK
jgi:acetyl-CoA acyltransferase